MSIVLIFIAFVAMFGIPLYYLTHPLELDEIIIYDITHQTPMFWLFVILAVLFAIGIFIHKQIK